MNLFFALLVAALGSDIWSSACWRRLWHAITFFWARGAKVDLEHYRRRLATCHRCTIFFKPLGTCGSPMSDDPDLGCWCHMATKAKYANSTCWADNELGDTIQWGWRGSENPQAGAADHHNPQPPANPGDEGPRPFD